MYLNLCCIMRQWLCNALNKAADENSLPYQIFFCHSPKLENQASPRTECSNPPPQPVGLAKTSSSIGSPKMTSTSCRVIDISPCKRWNIWVSSRHRSTRVNIRPWSISLDGALNNISSLTNLIMSITRLSCIDMFAISLERPRHWSGLGSCKIDKSYSGC